MDELEISGKRYISTRRAAKDNKYHSDYIGQLIRAGKVEGQKVGRSWYVAADSLADYLGKETPAKVSPPRAPVFVKEIVREEGVVAEEKLEVNQETIKTVVPVEVEKQISHTVENNFSAEEENFIPIKITQQAEIKEEIPVARTMRSGLRYMADDGPLYPREEREIRSQIKLRPEPTPIIEEEAVFIEQEPVVITERQKSQSNFKNIIVYAGAVVAIGVVTLGVVAAASSFVVSTTTIQGETASVSYSVASIK